jgi:protein TonB
MPPSNSYLDARPAGRRSIGLAIAVAFHVIMIYALVTGLGRKVIEIIKQPIETKIIEEVKPPPPPPPEAPPPPPKLSAPPPPFIPPPEIKIQTPPPVEPTITAVTQEKPPAPAAPVIQKPVEAAPAPPPPRPAPPPPKPRLRTGVNPIFRPASPTYPRQLLREGITGSLVLRLTVSPAGDVIAVKVIQADPKRVFDKAAIEYVQQFKFEKGEDEFEVDQPISFNIN